ncbi:Conserved hypothetical, protein [Geosmithia morbida]|uniref:Conserved hypothetical, protein n=1 Tax=Geosmithia morbida TaxID=1094350 RepID=A0A9P4YV48_9HYPO|nr:Conserved hypothetical, protein [Geosmithia morbida]KAF4122620.1 Conserved hypothetical, protein [Geosmithia morbida]
MSSYEPYERDYSRRYVREERRDERDPRFLESRDYAARTAHRELVPRAARREDSELSVEEIRRDFPPPSGGRDTYRARSAEPSYGDGGDGYYYEDDYYRDDGTGRRRHHHHRHQRHGGGSSRYDYDDGRSYKSSSSAVTGDGRRKKGTISKEEKIIAAIAGAALLAGGKEMYDRREAKQDGHGHGQVDRNVLASAALAGVGALAAYQGIEFYNKSQARKDKKATYILHRGRDGNISEYYSDDDGDDDDDDDVSRKHRKGAKNFLESAIAATGLGAAVKSLTGGGHDDDKSSRHRSGSDVSTRSHRSRGGGGGGGGENKIQKSAMAALLAGATEAFRVAKEPGGWKGEKAKRILTVAAGAATVDAAHGDKHGKLGLAESVIGGLVGNRLINGSKNDIEEDRTTGRSRSRSRARSGSRGGGGGGGGGSGLAALATAGLGALGAKKVLDSNRDGSRSRSRSRDRSRTRRSRSRSVVDRARDGLADLGIGGGSRRARDYSDDDGDERYRQDDYGDRRGGGYADGKSRPSRHRRSGYASGSDLGDSDEDEKRARKMKGKQILSTGLATAATINAAHEVYESLEKRQARQKALREGRISHEQSERMKRKNIMQDLASVGIAALGVRNAMSKVKEARHASHECRDFKSEKKLRHQRRLEQTSHPHHRDDHHYGGGRRSESSHRSTGPRRPPLDGYDSDDDEDWSIDPPPRRRYSHDDRGVSGW